MSNEPTNAVTTIVNNDAQYSAGTGGGSALKYAVNLPNPVTVRVADGSSDLTPKTSKNEVHGEPEVKDEFTVIVEFWSKF